MKRHRPVLLFLVLALSLVPPGAVVATESDAVRTSTQSIASFDGTRLSATLYWQDAAETTPRPAVLMTHGWGGAKEDLADEARWLARQGYVVLAYDSRGFGASEGEVGLNGPDEVADAQELVTWLARLNDTDLPRVLLDDATTEDPRLAMFGYSYGGAIQLLAAAQDGRIDAIVPDITWSDLADSLAPDSVVKRGWVDLLFWGGILGAFGARHTNPNTGGMDQRLYGWYIEAQQTGRFPAEAYAALDERSPRLSLQDIKADVLLMQGWYDTLFSPDEALRNREGLMGRAQGSDVHLLFHPGGHGHELADGPRGHVERQVERFLQRHLDGADVSVPQVQWYDLGRDTWRTADAWPPAGFPVQDIVAADDRSSLTLYQAPPPSSHTENQEFEGAQGGTEQDAPLPTNARIPLRLDAPFQLLGTPVVEVALTTDVDDLTLFLSLVEVAGDGSARVIGNQVTPVRVQAAADQPVSLTVPMVPVSHDIGLGRELALRIATSDSGYLGAREVGVADLDLGSLRVSLPVREGAPQAVPVPAPDEAPSNEGRTPAPPALLVVVVLALLGAGQRCTDRRWRP